MRIVLLGPPGAGKGTQAVKLADKLGVPQISTGDLFRHNISTGTELGLEAKKYLDAGDLVPAELTNALVDDRLDADDTAAGFILDGFPRSVEQAVALRDMLAKRNLKLDAVLEFRVSESELLTRLKSRGRADDTEEVILNRMKVYRDETAPLLDYYRDELVSVDAVGSLQPAGVVAQHGDLVGGGYLERVDPVVRYPRDIDVRRLGCQLDALGVERRQRHRHGHRAAGRLGRHGEIQFRVRSETPGAVDDDPHRQADLAGHHRGLQLTVAQLDVLGGDPVNPEVGVARTGSQRGRHRGIGQQMARQGQEVGVNPSQRSHGYTVMARHALMIRWRAAGFGTP